MMKRKVWILILISALFWSMNDLVAQQVKDSTLSKTPFRKGRWITGLSGTISSGSNSLDTISSGVSRNQYAIDFRTGKFVKDRFLVGGLISFSRNKSEEFVKRTLETLFAGPLLTWYLTDGEQGSLFLSGAGGYVNFRDESGSIKSENPSSLLIEGNGVGILVGFGYSYVLHDRVAFGLSLNYENSWLSADLTQEPDILKTQEDFVIADLSFSFGFSVILDNFFF